MNSLAEYSNPAMCGIAGIFSNRAPDLAVLNQMAQAIVHRGPDDGGIWTDAESGIGFAHRRLSIVDLSQSGHQPMETPDGRLVLNFNGEIYNHRSLRTEVESFGGVPAGGWRGHSDTETLLAAISTWGLDGAIRRATGMFALALWDSRKRVLALARDRFGEKPLYYGWAGRDFVFGSELKALKPHPNFDNSISRRALKLYAAQSYVPAPFTIYERIYKLPPGCVLELTQDACTASLSEPPGENRVSGGLHLHRYWAYREVIERGLADPIVDRTEALNELDRTLDDAIRSQSMADVPVGAFLSGGIDSSTIAALYQRHSAVPIRTYTIAFEEASYNEASDARKVAEHLGTVHHEHLVTACEAQNVIPSLPTIYDEPFADSSQIPTFLVSRVARAEVKVALTGDGGDELFGGYARHFSAPSIWQHIRRVPTPIRSIAGAALATIPSSFWSRASDLLPGRRQPHFGGKLQKAFRVLSKAETLQDLYFAFLDEWSFERHAVRGDAPLDWPVNDDPIANAQDALSIMYYDAVGYLPDDILCKVDRASMAVSLETRVPFLDHRVAEAAARIPLNMKLEGGCGKQIVRRLLSAYVPQEILERPKAGFAIPVGEWIKGPLRPWAEDLLNDPHIAQDGWFDWEVVQRRWEMHLNGRRDSTQALWAILMFQAWHRQETEGRHTAT